MSLLDKRVCEEDINRVSAVRHHPKYEPGFEKECREEEVWYIKGGNNLPFGYYMFEDIQQQYDRWYANQMRGEQSVGRPSVGSSGTINISKEPIEKSNSESNLLDYIWDWFYAKLMMWSGMK